MVVFLLQGYLTSGRAVRPASFCECTACCAGGTAPRLPVLSVCGRLGLHASPSCGCSDHSSGGVTHCCMQALIRTLWLSGGYAAFETFVAAVYIFGAHVPLFLYGSAAPRYP